MLVGGTPRFIALAPHGKNPGDPMTSADWKLDPKELESLFNEKTKAHWITFEFVTVFLRSVHCDHINCLKTF